ncbi:MAG: VWA domain-containing protein [Desulfurococcales archaeon]|nr:VWA domain-containing protein [Desulfurococcales archaeon]
MSIDDDDIINTIIEVGYKLRGQNKTVSTADLVKAVELAKSYKLLTGSMTRTDLAYILWTSFTGVQAGLEYFEELVAKELAGRGVRERAEKIARELRKEIGAMGVRPGDRVSKKRLAKKSSKERRAALASYTKLKSIGAIRGRPGRERLLSNQELDRLAWRIALNGYSSIDEAARGMYSARWDDLMNTVEARIRPDRSQLSGMSERNLLKLAEAAKRKHDRTTRELVAEELARRVNSGSRIHDPNRVAEILEDAGLLTPVIRRRLASVSRLDVDKLGVNDIIDAANTMGIDAGGELVAKGVNSLDSEDARKLVSSVNPRLLWSLGRGSLRKLGGGLLLEAAVNAAKSLREALKYAETGDEARADMAKYYVERALRELHRGGTADGSSLVNYSHVVEMIKESNAIIGLATSLKGPVNPGLVDEALRGLDYPARIRLLRDMYRRANPEWSRLILRAAERILNRFSAREGLRLLRDRYLGQTPPGRIDVRRSIYGSIRYAPRPIVYLKRKKTSRISLALDSSGSMLDYSTWAIAVASLFPRHLQRLVVFSHDTIVHEGPFTKREFIRALFDADFTGFTNISKALLQANVPGVKKMIVITDLRQTIRDEPVEEVVARLVKAGKRVIFIVPGSHDEITRVRVEEQGARVVIASTPRRAAQHLLRILLRS